MKKKLSLLLVLVMVFSIFITACGDKGANDNGSDKGADVGNGKDVEDTKDELTSQDIIDKGKLIMGTNAEYPPFEFHILVDGKDEIVGLDIEIAKYIANELGVELEIKDMDFGNLLGALDTGMIDVAIAAMNPAPDRDANFTDIYYEVNHGVLVHKDNDAGITSLEDLNGKKIGVQRGTVQEEIANNEIKDAEVISLDNNSDAVMNLKTKKVDCIIMEAPVAKSYAQANDDIMVAEGIDIDSGTDGVAIAVKTGNDELTEKLNEIIADMISQGLIEKWFVEAEELSNEAL